MQKNVASQKWVVFAFDETDNTAKTGDAANITAEISADGAAGGGNITDTNPTELEDGYYVFDISQGESNGDYLLLLPESATANIQVIGCPAAVWTTAPYYNAQSIDSNGRVDVIKIAGTTQTANDNGADVNTIVTTTGANNAFWNVFILTAGTIGATGNDTTHLHLTGQTYGNDELNDYILVVYDNSESEYHSVWITDWVLATALATVETLPFTPENSVDTYWIFSLKKHPDIAFILAGTVTNAQGADVATDVAAAIGTDSKCLISTDAQDLSGTLDVNTKTFTAGSLANATFNADVGSTAHGTNIIALAVRKILEELNLDHLCKTVTAAADMTTEVADNTIFSRILANGDTSAFVPSTDAIQLIRDELVVVDTVADAIKVVTDNLANAATTIVSGTVSWDNTNATTTVFYSDDITEATADHYKGRIVIFTSGVVQNQASDITAYALDTGEGKFTVTALTEAPADNVTFVIV